MGANKTEKAIERMSKAAAGIWKIVDVFEDQTLIKPKSSTHSHKSSTEDEKKIMSDLEKLKPFSCIPGRCHSSFMGISADPLDNLDEDNSKEWLQRHRKNISLHFPAVDDVETIEEESGDIANLLSSLQVDDTDMN
jgi:hypothetical protein